ncbi:hypothetical protein [Methylobacterium sp. WL9]|uniref:hypothetical protein n=1 Tax=Methylobacterium sp. WL9 TaxID=2603898 RepID=UPI0011CB96B2|nr:hypothetical protein [Methylobacterium sp. WL9]TXN21132.1 hypothetical protein FV217_15400 [Methylobacterium sp. WL9]
MTEIFIMPADLVEGDWYSIISSEVAPAVDVELPSRQNVMLPAVTSMGGRQDIVQFDVAVALKSR